MAPMKRPASAAAAGAAKRSARDPISKKCNLVAEAVRESEELPENVGMMLAEMVPYSLSVMAAERHPSQSKAVEMVEEALKGIETKMSIVAAEAQAKVDNAAAEKDARFAAVVAGDAKLVDSTEKSVAARALSESDKAALSEAKANVVAAKAAQTNTEDDLVAKAETLAEIQTAMESFKELQASKKIQGFHTVGKVLAENCGAEASMVEALHSTLKKEPAARGSFDVIVEQQATEAFTSTVATFQQTLAAGDSTKAAAVAATTAAEAACAAATEKSTASDEAFKAAIETQRSAEESVEEAKEAVDSFAEEAEKAKSDLEEAKETFQAFLEGPRAVFAELKELAPAPEKPEQQEEAAVPPEEAQAMELSSA